MPSGVYQRKPNIMRKPLSEETKRKIGEANKGKTHKGYWRGKHFSEEHRKRIGEATLQRKKKFGYIVSPEARKKISDANRGRKLSIEHIARMRESQLGKKASKETKQKMSIAHKRIGVPWLRGKPLSTEHRRKLSETEKGEKAHNWKGGVSKRKGYSNFMKRRRNIRKLNNGGSHTLDEWETLKAQYNWTCPCCKRKESTIKLTEDHIIPIIKGGSDNIENIQPLCRSCNSSKQVKVIKYVRG